MNSNFNKYFSKDLDYYDDLYFLSTYIEFKIKNGREPEKFADVAKMFKNFSWKNKDAKKYFYEDVVEPLYLEISEEHKKIFSNLNDESKYIIGKLFITYDFQKNNYKYFNNENLISEHFTALEKKQDFYELYYDLLIDEGIYLKNYKYKNYFRDEFKKKSVEKYLRYEFKNITFRTFDFSGEDKYDTYESGGGCYFRKAYHSSSYSLRKTKNNELLYLEDEVKKNTYSRI